jgi:hypothetical protein
MVKRTRERERERKREPETETLRRELEYSSKQDKNLNVYHEPTAVHIP